VRHGASSLTCVDVVGARAVWRTFRPARAWQCVQVGRHLNLPLSIFNDFDPEEIGEINLYQLFLMLTLFCVGLPERKAQLWCAPATAACAVPVLCPAATLLPNCVCVFAFSFDQTSCLASACAWWRDARAASFCCAASFRMYDIDESGTILRDEFAKFIFGVAEALVLIGVTSYRPPEDTLNTLVSIIFKVAESSHVSALPPACDCAHTRAFAVSRAPGRRASVLRFGCFAPCLRLRRPGCGHQQQQHHRPHGVLGLVCEGQVAAHACGTLWLKVVW
jgi:hypothetical protein